jgi:putative isomerase
MDPEKSSRNAGLAKYAQALREYLTADYPRMLRPAGGILEYPFLAAGSDAYADCLWDWDSWLCDVALRQVLADLDDPDALEAAREYERGCVLNYLHIAKQIPPAGTTGYIPIMFNRKEYLRPDDIYSVNMHKPCLAQHAAFLTQQDDGDAEWLREYMQYLLFFINNYRNHHRHECGIYFWQSDQGVGVDNDPTSYDRLPKTSGNILLNCFMLKELRATAYLLERLNLGDFATEYAADADALARAIQKYCWDERDGFFYSVDFSFKPVVRGAWKLHSGDVRPWPCLPMRIGVWSGVLGLWAGVASAEQADRVVQHLRNPESFNAPFGIRTLSKQEPMFSLKVSSNPSCWLGPIWGSSNYFTFRALLNYGYEDDARDLAEKTVHLFGRDLERFGALHEYYQPENGEPALNRGFMNWNYLVANMIAWLEGRSVIQEF